MFNLDLIKRIIVFLAFFALIYIFVFKYPITFFSGLFN